MKYTISESRFESFILKFVDNYLMDYPMEENSKLILFGSGDRNKIAYDKEDMILFVSDTLSDLVKNMFSLTYLQTRQVFRDYMESKGYKVKRFI